MGRRGIRASAAVLLASLVLLPGSARAEPKQPAWKLEVVPTPSTFVPGAEDAGGLPAFTLLATNIGGDLASGSVSITTTLPAGLNPGLEPPVGLTRDRGGGSSFSCTTAARTVACTGSVQVPPGATVAASVPVVVEAVSAPSTVIVGGTIEGGGAAAASASRAVEVSAAVPKFGFPDGTSEPSAAFTSEDGATFTQAGGHPFLLTLNAALNTVGGPAGLRGAGGDLRDLEFELPPGVIVNPSSTAAACTQIALEQGHCPLSSQIGLVQLRSAGGGTLNTSPAPLFEMVPPPGVASDFGFEYPGTGIFLHILGEIRVGDQGAGGYTFAARSESLPTAFGVVGIQVQFWGDSTSGSLDLARGGLGTTCRPSSNLVPCGVEPRSTPQLTAPTSCPAQMAISAVIDSWQDPGQLVGAHGYFQDPSGTPTGASGCAALEFTPSLSARPTSAVADSPTAFEVDLAVPRQEELGSLAQSDLKDLTVTLPEGLSVNPSAANGLDSCSLAQVGIDPDTGRPNQAQPTCPDASRIGTLEVETPLLDHPLPGRVYLATPRENPFGSLLAMYAVVNDPVSGILIKLPARVHADEATGRLEASLEASPQFPFTRFSLRLDGGAGAMLRTPARCGRYATTSTVAPWSGNPAAHPSDEYAISLPPSGGPCPTVAGSEPNSPSLEAGLASSAAGTYSPLIIDLSREDGSQEFSTLSLAAPPGITGKLAGIPYCPDSALRGAAVKSGHQEEKDPSCSPGSLIGTAAVAAGAGPDPYWATGRVYLTGPYKGAPIGAAVIVPAVAGPLDLGTVVVRGAISVDPRTAQLTLESDEIPHILHGIPLDIRQVRIRLDRAEFTRSGTSCGPLDIRAQEVSTSGQAKSLSARFQLGKCAGLRFKPNFRVSLGGALARNGHPSLRAIVSAREGEAGIATTSFTLPPGELLDLRHLHALCAGGLIAQECPKASRLGTAQIFTPLFAAPLEGPVFLRRPSHGLPGLLADLRGAGMHLSVIGETDTRSGRVRIRLPELPDIAVSKIIIDLPGGRRGLFVNSEALCRRPRRGQAQFEAHNGKHYLLRPLPRLRGC